MHCKKGDFDMSSEPFAQLDVATQRCNSLKKIHISRGPFSLFIILKFICESYFSLYRYFRISTSSLYILGNQQINQF